VPEQGGNVIEKNARFWKIRDAANMRLQVQLVVCVCHVLLAVLIAPCPAPSGAGLLSLSAGIISM
jgi:hypothetical protein